MTVTFENNDMAKAICRACKAPGCRYKWRGLMLPCPFKPSSDGPCEPGQFSPDDIRDLFDIVVMENFYRKGKVL